MRFSAFLVAGLLLLNAAPVRAADDSTPKVNDQVVRLSPVGLPIVVDGQIVNYVFVTVQIDLTPSADMIALQAKEPDFRDALVREAHRNPFVLPNDFNHVNEARLKSVMYRDAVAIAGQRSIRGVEVLSQTAQHFVRPPRPRPAVAP